MHDPAYFGGRALDGNLQLRPLSTGETSTEAKSSDSYQKGVSGAIFARTWTDTGMSYV
jgi:hypothetical protein